MDFQRSSNISCLILKLSAISIFINPVYSCRPCFGRSRFSCNDGCFWSNSNGRCSGIANCGSAGSDDFGNPEPEKTCWDPQCLEPSNRTMDPCKENYERLSANGTDSSVGCLNVAPNGAPAIVCRTPVENVFDSNATYTCEIVENACSIIEIFSLNKATCIDLGCEWQDSYCLGDDDETDTNGSFVSGGKVQYSWTVLIAWMTTVTLVLSH